MIPNQDLIPDLISVSNLHRKKRQHDFFIIYLRGQIDKSWPFSPHPQKMIYWSKNNTVFFVNIPLPHPFPYTILPFCTMPQVLLVSRLDAAQFMNYLIKPNRSSLFFYNIVVSSIFINLGCKFLEEKNEIIFEFKLYVILSQRAVICIWKR